MPRLAALAAAVLAVHGLSFLAGRAQGQEAPEVSKLQRRASVVESLKNPVKTVSETIDDFYKVAKELLDAHIIYMICYMICYMMSYDVM